MITQCHWVLLFSGLLLCSNFLVVGGLDFDPLILFPGFADLFGIKWSRVVTVDDFGAKGDGVVDDTEAFRDAWKTACSLTWHTILQVPKGTYLVRPIDFAGPCQSKLTLSIAGTIVSPEDPDVWEGLDTHKWLYFHGIDHLTVKGGGTINGMGEKWWARSCKINITNPCQHAPMAITFHRCTHVKVQDLTLLNSQQMHIAFTNCYRVTVSYLQVIAPAESPNTDGIHISQSVSVLIKHCTIKTGDDCISIVNHSSKVRIRQVFCGPGHGISIGSLGKNSSWDHVSDVRVNGAFITNTENGLRIKSWQGGRGYAHNIAFHNVFMQNVSNPIIIDQYYCDSFVPCQNQTSAVMVDDVSFVSIKGTSATDEAIKLSCSDTLPCQNIYLQDVQLFLSSGEPTSAFCWNAFGISSGIVYPPCFPSDHCFIEQEALFNATLLSVA
ncbi:putative polygalacturonase [Acorus calamus]|uniref:endo-polygalacturonase n=1 Tax=Acorus calamus TaxID=4465 RepID=A0AAV9DDH4_ACOCL|nr:putative polygalacturonase [Acorus calamus]